MEVGAKIQKHAHVEPVSLVSLHVSPIQFVKSKRRDLKSSDVDRAVAFVLAKADSESKALETATSARIFQNFRYNASR